MLHPMSKYLALKDIQEFTAQTCACTRSLSPSPPAPPHTHLRKERPPREAEVLSLGLCKPELISPLHLEQLCTDSLASTGLQQMPPSGPNTGKMVP